MLSRWELSVAFKYGYVFCYIKLNMIWLCMLWQQKNLAILWDLKKYWHVLNGRTFFNFASSYFSCNRKKGTVVQVEQRRLVIKLNLINKFCILKYASREPYIFPRKISNYYDHCCLLCLGNFLLQEYAGALVGGLLATLLHRAEIQGMIIKLEFIQESRKKIISRLPTF